MSRPTVFISYSHDSVSHKKQVLGLSERLRDGGIETYLDQYVNGSPLEGWPRWMLNQLDKANFVLVVCTETYYRRFRGMEEPDQGKGVDWEGALITLEMYDTRSVTLKFVPVLFADDQQAFIPEPLRGGTHYVLTSEENYQELYDFLLGQAGVEPGEVGELSRKPRAKGLPLTFDYDLSKSGQENRPRLSDVPNPFFKEEGVFSKLSYALRYTLNYWIVRSPAQLARQFSIHWTWRGPIIAAAVVALLLGGIYSVPYETTPNFDAEAVDDLFDSSIDYVAGGGWFWQSPVSAGWKIEKVEGYDKRIISGSRIGLFKNGQTENIFNMYQNFVLVFNARFSGDKGMSRRIGWVVRAKDFKNYYLLELVAAAGDQGRREFIATRYENGNQTMRKNPQVIENIDNPNDSFEIRTEVMGSQFRVCISPFISGPRKPRMLGDFTDSAFAYGGVGFLPQPGMDAHLEFLRVIPNPNLAKEGCQP